MVTEIAIEVMTRTCFKCHMEKPLSEFHRSKNMPLGRGYECRTCKKSRDAGRVNDWPRNEATKALNRERSRQLYLDKPEATKARAMIAKLISDGLIKRLDCQVCGKEKTDGHHPDYEKPLEVIWLCRSHHWLIERIINGSGETMPALFIHSYEDISVAAS